MVPLVRNLPLPLYLGSVEMTRLYRVAHLWYSLPIKSDHPLGASQQSRQAPSFYRPLSYTAEGAWPGPALLCYFHRILEAFARDYSVTPRTNPAVQVETTGRVSVMAFCNATLFNVYSRPEALPGEGGTIGIWSKGGNMRTSVTENGTITKKGSTGKVLNY